MSLLSKLFGKSKETTSEQPPTQNSKNGASHSQNSHKEDSARILPRIKVNYGHEIYAADQSKKFVGNPLPQGITLTENQQPICKTLFEDLMLCFAVDRGDSYELLQNEFLVQNTNFSKELLQQVSVNALVDEIGGQIKMNGDPENMVMITAGGNFEAAIILLEGFWDKMHNLMDGNVVLSIPARDLLFICKESNLEAILKMKDLVKSFFDNPDTQGLLSKALYRKISGRPELRILEPAF